MLKEGDGIKRGDAIDVLESASIIQTLGGKQLLLKDDYKPLEKNKEYILFLKKNDWGQYCIINNNLGKLDLSNKDKKLDAQKDSEKFMKDAFEKYQTTE